MSRAIISKMTYKSYKNIEDYIHIVSIIDDVLLWGTAEGTFRVVLIVHDTSNLIYFEVAFKILSIPITFSRSLILLVWQWLEKYNFLGILLTVWNSLKFKTLSTSRWGYKVFDEIFIAFALTQIHFRSVGYTF